MMSVLKKIGKCLSLCAGILFIIAYMIINYSHYLTCYLHVGFCTPLNKFTNALENIYSMMGEEQYNKSIHEVWNKNYNSSFNGTKFKNPYENILKFGILLTDTDFEANWISKKLNNYNEINIIHTSFSFIEISNSQSQILIHKLDEMYHNCIDTMNKNLKNETYCFLSIQIKHFPLSLYDVLVEYIHYHNITVLQIYRQALLASYLDAQSENEITLKYIESIEEQRDKLSKMIKLFPKYIKHQRFDYEDLIGIYSSSYWNALMIWIGNSLSANKINSINELEDYKMNVQKSCLLEEQKWSWIEKKLSDTEEYYLCKKYAHNSFYQ
eukprot:442001_1